jgi:hypothetical protein
VVIESDVTHIGNNAFTDCRNLATVTFAAGSQLTSIGDLAFYYCNNSLNTITIPASVQTIGSNAFNSCNNLATVSFAAGSQLTTIENSAFDKCSALTAFTVPSGVSAATATPWPPASICTSTTMPQTSKMFNVQCSMFNATMRGTRSMAAS